MTDPLGNNPILRTERLRRGMSPRPAPRADTTLVFTDAKGNVYAPGRPVTMGEAIFGGLRMLYEVDLADHTAQFSCDLPCTTDAFFFHTDVRLSWRVHDPEEVVRRRVADGDAACQDYLEEEMRRISHRHALQDAELAEREIIDTLGSHPLEIGRGITIVECRVRLLLDDMAKDHVRTMVRSGQEFKEIHEQHNVDLRTQQYQQDLDQVRQQAELDNIRVRELADLQMARLRQQQELELAKARDIYELDMKQQRMDFYQKAIDQGAHSLFLLQLTEHPGDVKPVIDMLLKQESTVFENNRAFLETLGNAGLLQDAEVDEPRRRALKNLVQSLEPTPLAGLLKRGEPPLPTGSAPAPPAVDSTVDAEIVQDAESDDEDDEY